jgi:hypothetical protein
LGTRDPAPNWRPGFARANIGRMDLSPAARCANLVGLPRRPTVTRFLDFWLAHVAWPSLRFTTARTYAGVVVHIIAPTLGHLSVRRLALETIMRKRGVSIARDAIVLA